MDADPWADAAPAAPAVPASPSKSTTAPSPKPLEDDGDIGLSLRSPTLSPVSVNASPRTSMSPSKPALDLGWGDEGDIGGEGVSKKEEEEEKEVEEKTEVAEEENKELGEEEEEEVGEEKEEREDKDKEEKEKEEEIEPTTEEKTTEDTAPPSLLPAAGIATAIDPPADEFGSADDGFKEAAFDDAFQDEDNAFAAADDGFGEGDDGFSDFDDFDEPAAFDDDGFGDFGEFGEGEGQGEGETREPPPPPPPAAPSIDWTALSLRPVPPLGELLERVAAVLEPLTPDSTNFTDEPPRAVGGLAQVLATESCRDAFAQLTTAPMLKPLDWTRSRVRRDHLISMGVPVNLDEITTTFRSKSVGPEAVSRPSEAGNGPASAGPALGGAESERKYGLGARPALDTARAEDLCALEEEQLSLLPLSKLEALHADLARHSADASALLAWFLQLKDAQTHDSATYNGMISELIANAAKVKGGSTGGLFRRNSGRPASLSATPRRSGSPGVF